MRRFEGLRTQAGGIRSGGETTAQGREELSAGNPREINMDITAVKTPGILLLQFPAFFQLVLYDGLHRAAVGFFHLLFTMKIE